MNIWRAVSEHVEADLAEAKAEAAAALERYVVAQQTVMELQSLIELRGAMERPLASAPSLKLEASA